MRTTSLFFSLIFGLTVASPSFAQEAEKNAKSDKPNLAKKNEVKEERVHVFTYNPTVIDTKKDKLHKVVVSRKSKNQPIQNEEKGK